MMQFDYGDEINRYKVKIYNGTKPNELDMTNEFSDLTEILIDVFQKWDKTQCNNEAFLISNRFEAERFKIMGETIIAFANKAIENSKIA